MKILRSILSCVIVPVLFAGCAVLQPEHPLNGKLWDAGAHRFVEPAQLMDRAVDARYVLLGEIHDNAEQHRLQLRVLQEMLKRGKRPALVMEQYDLDQQEQIDAARKDHPAALEGLMRKSWNWAFYRPLVELAVKERLPIIAANASRELLRKVGRSGFAALGEDAEARLALDKTWNDARQQQLVDDVNEGHCGKAPEHVALAIVKQQRARDALMADAMLRAGKDGVVAILGNGHARSDLAVPLYLAARGAAADMLAIGLVQVDAPADPSAYASGPLGQRFDYVWFTGQARRVGNPCDSIPVMKGAVG